MLSQNINLFIYFINNIIEFLLDSEGGIDLLFTGMLNYSNRFKLAFLLYERYLNVKDVKKFKQMKITREFKNITNI